MSAAQSVMYLWNALTNNPIIRDYPLIIIVGGGCGTHHSTLHRWMRNSFDLAINTELNALNEYFTFAQEVFNTQEHCS